MGKAASPALIPGTPSQPTTPLARYRSPAFATFARTAIDAATEPGDLILELGTSDATYVREITALGRRALALNVNPIPLLWTHVALNPAPFDDVQTALTRLGDLPKGTRPFISHVRDLYRSRCPACKTMGTAEWFVWDRDTQRPIAKRVRCPHCDGAQEGDVDDKDLEGLVAFAPRTGPGYHIALGRAATIDDPLRERAAELVALYTPRNLSVLMDSLHRVSQASASPDVQRALTTIIVEALDRGSSLAPYDEPLARPRSLRPPQRFLEHNIWSLMEDALTRYGARQAETTTAGTPVDSLKALLDSPTGDHLLLAHPLHTVAQTLPPESVAAVILQPQPPDAVFWALSALWSTWLWKDTAHPALRAFLGRRRLDWDWYRRSLATTFRRLVPLLKPEAMVFVVIPDDNTTMLAHAIAAAAQAGLDVERWIACAPWGYRLAFKVAPTSRKQTAAIDAETRLTNILRRRGEPTTPNFMHARHLIATAVAAPAHLESLPYLIRTPAFTHLTPDAVWMASPVGAARPLADRVEENVLRLLQSEDVWERTALENAIYARFHGELSPEPALVGACIDAYTTMSDQGTLTLRPEDISTARGAEARHMRTLLQRLGENLAFQVTHSEDNDILWVDGEQPRYHFHLTTTALLAPHLLKAQLPISGRRCLVLPGGRAALIALKLRRDPRLQAIVEANNWLFIKFRHLRWMAAEITRRADIDVFLGLDPIVEQETVQIPLPWQ